MGSSDSKPANSRPASGYSSSTNSSFRSTGVAFASSSSSPSRQYTPASTLNSSRTTTSSSGIGGSNKASSSVYTNNSSTYRTGTSSTSSAGINNKPSYPSTHPLSTTYKASTSNTSSTGAVRESAHVNVSSNSSKTTYKTNTSSSYASSHPLSTTNTSSTSSTKTINTPVYVNSETFHRTPSSSSSANNTSNVKQSAASTSTGIVNKASEAISYTKYSTTSIKPNTVGFSNSQKTSSSITTGNTIKPKTSTAGINNPSTANPTFSGNYDPLSPFSSASKPGTSNSNFCGNASTSGTSNPYNASKPSTSINHVAGNVIEPSTLKPIFGSAIYPDLPKSNLMSTGTETVMKQSPYNPFFTQNASAPSFDLLKMEDAIKEVATNFMKISKEPELSGKNVKKCSNPNSSKLQIKEEEDLNKTSSLPEDLMKELECPVCLEHMTPPITMCLNGHSICNNCRPKLEYCPSCRCSFLAIRNRALEKIAEQIQRKCSFSKFGCNEAYPLHIITDHEKNCIHQPFHCPQSGAEGIFCKWFGAYSELKKHIEIKHKGRLTIMEGEKRVYLKNYDNKRKGTRIVLACDEIFHQQFEVIDNIFYFIVQHVGPEKKNVKYRYSFSLATSKHVESVHITFIARSSSVDIDEIYQSGQCVKLHFESVKNFLESKGNLLFRYNITQVEV